MLACWRWDGVDRPSFAEVRDMLQDLASRPAQDKLAPAPHASDAAHPNLPPLALDAAGPFTTTCALGLVENNYVLADPADAEDGTAV